MKKPPGQSNWDGDNAESRNLEPKCSCFAANEQPTSKKYRRISHVGETGRGFVSSTTPLVCAGTVTLREHVCTGRRELVEKAKRKQTRHFVLASWPAGLDRQNICPPLFYKIPAFVVLSLGLIVKPICKLQNARQTWDVVTLSFVQEVMSVVKLWILTGTLRRKGI